MNYEEIIAEKDRKIAYLQHEIAELRRLMFGGRKERFKAAEVPSNQLSLFGDLPQSEDQAAEVPKEQISYERTKPSKAHPGRNIIPEHFPVEVTILEPEEDTTGMIRVGEEITDYVEYTPSELKVIRTIRPRYAPAQGEGRFAIASLPNDRALPKSIASESLLTWLITRKFVEHMPFYRQRQAIIRDYKWDIPPSTINEWFISVCSLLEPLYNRIKEKVLKSGYIQVDESPIKVLDSDKPGSTHQGYQWVYHSPEEKVLFFDYRKGRGNNGPKEILEGYVGLLQSDGYGVYDNLSKQKGITLAGCLVHARRGFEKALESDKKRAEKIMHQFQTIYRLEASYKSLDVKSRQEQRETHILPIILDIKRYIEEECIYVLPKSPLGKAMSYYQSQLPKLLELFKNGRYELDNNLIENKIRPLALGRKNYLFAGSHDGAKRIAMMYTFFGTCAANNINPSQWLISTLKNINNTKINDIDKLLPHNFNM